MGLFRRRRDSTGPERAQAIAQFWRWWSTDGAAEATHLLAQEPERLPKLLGPAVHQLDPNLSWAVGGGREAAQLLVVTAGGNLDLRALTRRWLLAAPAPDEIWSYSDVRPPVPDPDLVRLQIGACDIDAVRAVAAAQVQGAAVHAAVHHPDFDQLDEGTRTLAAQLLLDAVLGEADAEIWVGGVTGTDIEPLDGVPLRGLRAVVRDLKAEHTDEAGRPRWVELSGSSRGSAVAAAAQVPLLPGTAPQLDTYVAVAVPYADRTPEGLPGPAARARLGQLQAHIDAELGPVGSVVAHQSQAGLRLLHVYVDSTTDAVERLKRAVSAWDQARARVAGARHDPSWQAVAHLRI